MIFAYGLELPEEEGFVPLEMDSNRSMLDADIIVVEPTMRNFRTGGKTFQGRGVLTEHSSAMFKDTKLRWYSQIVAALEAGKNVFILLTTKDDKYYYTGERVNLGTAGRPRMQANVEGCSNYDFVPVPLDNVYVAEGEGIKIVGYGIDFLKDFWKEFGNCIGYTCYFGKKENWNPLATTKGGEHVVASIVKVYNGNVILLPELNWAYLDEEDGSGDDGDDGDDSGDSEREEGEWPPAYRLFTIRLRDAFLKLDKKLSDPEEQSVPDWVLDPKYRLSEEEVLESEMRSLVHKMDELRYRHQELELSLRHSNRTKNLLFGSGKPLEEAVREALKDIGFSVEYVSDDQSEFDAIFVSEEGRFLGEVEGRDRKAIDISKASQLHRNLSEDFTRNDLSEVAVGVLFGNAHRISPIEDRGEFFTEKVVNFCRSIGIVLVRTPDLFEVARYVRETKDMDFATLCRKEISESKGKVVTFPQPKATGGTDAAEAEAVLVDISETASTPE